MGINHKIRELGVGDLMIFRFTIDLEGVHNHLLRLF